MSGKSGSGGTERHPRRGGFTLFELLLVLFVVALAGVIVMPDMAPLLDRTRLEASTRATASFLDGLRGKAVLTGEVLVVTHDEEEGRLVARRDGEGEGTIAVLALPAGDVEVLLEPDEVRYFPQGYSSGGRIIFRRGEEDLYEVEIGSFTGLSRILADTRQ